MTAFRIAITPVFVVLSIFALISMGEKKAETGRRRQGKVFSLFNIVSFRNEPCQSTTTNFGGTSAFRNGTCFTTSECASRGGTVSGSCASGFGSCCVFIISDTTRSIQQNCTYVQNPGFPSTLTSTNALQFTVTKSDPSVCFLRLDFGTFTILGPGNTVETNGGACVDTFIVTTPTSQRIPTICGQNTGQHMYIDIGAASSDSASLSFAFTGASNIRQFDIKVSQIPCASVAAPPRGCLQYVTGLTGRLTTFNFLDATGSSHLANQQYTQCIRQELGFCCIQYQVCPDANSFSIDNSIAAATSQMDTQCTLDFVSIEGSSGVCQPMSGVSTVEKFCGRIFNAISAQTTNAVVCDCSAPFEVGIVTDNLQDTSSTTLVNRGVCLTYQQLPCS